MQGGELVVSHGGISEVFDFSQFSDNPERIQWAAFFGDCIHEVKQVTEGHRITITFSIMLVEEDDRPYIYHRFMQKFEKKGPVSPLKSQQLAEKFTDIIDKKLKKDLFGLILSHKYTLGGLNFGTLKQVDKLLVDAFAAKWNKLILMPVLLHEYTTTYRPEYYDDIDDDQSVYAFTKEDYLYLIGKSEERPKHGLKNVPFIMGDYKGTLLDREEVEGSEHTGNEARAGYFEGLYFTSAVIVDKRVKKEAKPTSSV